MIKNGHLNLNSKRLLIKETNIVQFEMFKKYTAIICVLINT